MQVYKQMKIIPIRQLTLLSGFAIVIVRFLQGWGLLRQLPLFCYSPNFSALSKHELAVEYYVYLAGDTCQI